MTRKSALWLCLAHLTLLTGCQHIPYFGASSEDGLTKTYEYPPPNKNAQGTSGFSTAMVAEEENPAPTGRLPKGPAPEASPLAVAPLGVALAQNQNANAPLQPKAGVIGLVALEVDTGGALPTPARSPAQPAAPIVVQKQREYNHAVECLQLILEKRHEEAIQQLRGYDEATQGFLLEFLPAVAVFIQKPIGELTPQEIAGLYNHLSIVQAELRKRSELVISKMCYCKRVYGFGSYTTLPDNHAFLAAATDRPGELVQLYVELKNFASEREAGKDGDFLTKLSCTLELRDARGEKVWSHAYDRNETTQRRRTRLTDLHGNYSFYVPAVPAGTYQLRLQIVDETLPGLRRVARKELDFRVTPVAGESPR